MRNFAAMLLLMACSHTPVQTHQVTQSVIGVVYEQTLPDPTDPCPTTSVIIKDDTERLSLYQSTTPILDMKGRYVKISELATYYDQGCTKFELQVEALK